VLSLAALAVLQRRLFSSKLQVPNCRIASHHESFSVSAVEMPVVALLLVLMVVVVL
jgi:hypothetical protein